MIRPELSMQALRALHRLIVHARTLAAATTESRVAELLNDVELLPEYLADERDRSGEFVEMLQGILTVHPDCRYIVEEFESTSRAPNAAHAAK